MLNSGTPSHFTKLIPNKKHSVNTRIKYVFFFSCGTDVFRNFIYPSTISRWYKLDARIRNFNSIVFYLSISKTSFQVINLRYLKLFIRLRLGLSHLNHQKLKLSFQDSVNALCICSLEAAETLYYFLYYHHHFTKN